MAIHREARQCALPPHRHEFRELVIILSGQCIHNYNGQRYRIGRGNVLFIDEESHHAYEEPECLNLVNILINTKAILRMERDLAQLPGYHVLFDNKKHTNGGECCLDDANIEKVLGWIDNIDEEIHAEDNFAGFIVAEAYLTLILSLILRHFKEGKIYQSDSNKFNNTINWLDANLHKPISVPILAQRAGMSERNFYRKFKRVYEMSPAHYINRARLQRAAMLLNHEELSCDTIAHRCGFSNSGYFSSCFVSEYGETPSAYRKHYSKKSQCLVFLP